MKNTATILFITLVIAFSNCSTNTERISLTADISVELPENYRKTDDQSRSGIISYVVINNLDQISTAVITIDGIDTLSSDQKKEMMEANAQGFMKAFNGKQITNSHQVIHGVMQNDFSCEFEKQDSLFAVFGRLIVLETDMLILSYQTPAPITKSSMKSKDKFFKSIIIK